ncbi:MAG TPA: 3-isopropylmalate dehydratase small subunit [Vicinamibacterales bacterium]|nr:3-isopropylmalate dehydratase small subunit [Vicinamibacterales bacterium]
MSRVTVVRGRGLPIRGDEIDTDRIIPARFLKSVTFDGLEQHLFEDDRAAAPHPLDDPRFAGASILLVNRNFGCGSSREHAPQAIHRRGIGAVVGESFSEIFFGNAVALGLPCVTVSRADASRLMDVVEAAPGTELEVDLERGTVTAGPVQVAAALPQGAREAFLTGAWDATGLLRERPEEVAAVAGRLPYVDGFGDS